MKYTSIELCSYNLNSFIIIYGDLLNMNARAKLEGGISVANYNFVKIPSKLPKYPEIP